MSDETDMPPHGLTYVSRDADSEWDLLSFLSRRPLPAQLPRPERDVLRSLLLFCIEGLDGLDAQERFGVLLPTPVAAPVDLTVAQHDQG